MCLKFTWAHFLDVSSKQVKIKMCAELILSSAMSVQTEDICEVAWVRLFLESNLISAWHTNFLLYHKCSYRKEFGLALL